MASRVGPRSVKDATRFTSNIPHATSKSASPSSSSVASKAASRIPGETPEQRVRRLRQAHLAAQRAQVSQTDRFLNRTRRFLDAAHRFTIGGVILFTAVAGVVSVYSVWDMLRYNRARRAEWVEAQKKLEADELATARLAYLKGTATEEQIELVEYENEKAEKQGVKLPPLLGAPEHRTHFEETFKGNEKEGGKGMMGVFSGLFGGKKEEAKVEEEKTAASTAPETAKASVEASVAKAKSVWEQEKENQRQGGALDQLGLETGSSVPQPAKKGWWPW